MMKEIKWGPSWTDNYGDARIGHVKLQYHQEGATGKTWIASASLCLCDYHNYCKCIAKTGKQMKSIKAVRDDAVRLAHELLSGIAADLKHFE